MKDLAQKTIDGVRPTLEQAKKISDEELVERSRSSADRRMDRRNVFDLPLGRPTFLPSTTSREKRLVPSLHGKNTCPTQGTSGLRRTLAPYRTVASWYMWRAFERRPG